MNTLCVAPQEIEEGDILAFVEGDALPAVHAHLARCPACQVEAESLRLLLRQLGPDYERSPCPGAEELLFYQTGLLSPARHGEVATHLSGCLACTMAILELEATGGDSRPAPSASPARDGGWMGRLVERVAAGWRVLTGTPLAAGIGSGLATRGSDSATTLYQAGDYQLLLRIGPDETVPKRLTVEGWLAHDSGNDEPSHATSVYLTAGVGVVSSGQVNEMGYFVLDNLAPGRYSLHLELRSTLVVIDALDASLGAGESV